MKKIQLYKFHDNHHIAHLYEHMYVARFLKSMRDNGLFKYVDYDIDAWTYYSGHILITVNLYNEHALTIFDTLIIKKYIYKTEDMHIALSQLIIEDGEYFNTNSKEALSDEIVGLEQNSWMNFKDFDFVMVAQKPKQSKILYTSNRSIRTKTIKLNLIFNNEENLYIFALFKQLARIFNDNCTDYICDTYGIVVDDFYYLQKSKNAKLETLIIVPSNLDTSINDIAIKYAECYKNLVKLGAIERYINAITSNTVAEQYKPNTHLTVRDNSVLIGEKGWHEIANSTNVDTILSSLQLVIKTYNSKVELSL